MPPPTTAIDATSPPDPPQHTSPTGPARRPHLPLDGKAKTRRKWGVAPPAPRSDYVELRCRSAFSFLEGASNPEDLAARAAELGHEALALADRGGVYGIPRFHQAARAAGLRAIVGASLGPLLLLVEERRGYRNLCR